MLLLAGSGRALGTVWRLQPETPLSVGRKDVPLLIERDHSVSRSHASICAGADDQAGVSITDNGSKFGVHINGRRCPANTQCRASVGDTVTFGAQDSTFKLCCCPVSLCIAGVRSDMLPLADSLQASAKALGISIAADVERCTHLLVRELAVTSKLIRALVFNRWIVPPGFVREVELLPLTFNVESPSDESVGEYIRTMRFLPTPAPPDQPADSPIDLGAVGWAPDERRQRLFTGKTFVFAESGQYDKYRTLIEAAQGACVMLAGIERWSQPPTHTAQELCALSRESADRMLALAGETWTGPAPASGAPPLHLVLPPALPEADAFKGPSSSAFVRETARLLGVRPMSESEISLAVLFVSCEHHTNAAIRDGGDADVDGHATPGSGDAAADASTQDRPRKRQRLSRYWEAAVAGDAQHPPPEAQQPAGPSATPGASVSGRLEDPHVPERRRRRMDDFWSSAALVDAPARSSSAKEASGSACTAGGARSGPPDEPDKDLSPDNGKPHGDTGAAVPDKHATPASEGPAAGTDAQVVALVKPKRTCVPRATGNAAAPNFKQFRKTVHPYQLEQR